MREFWRGEITLRKLRVLLDHLPSDAPTRWHLTDGKQFSLDDQLGWNQLWALTRIAQSLMGEKATGKDVYDGMPKFPWSEVEGSGKRFGSLGEGRTHEQVMAYLESMGVSPPE